MGLILLNLQSNHEIHLDKDNPFVIGRGNITGCTDKRVSRSHGKITCTNDGKVSLRALHSNPCFYTRKGAPPVRQLSKNEEEVLSEGDCLGLLPNSYWYQITSKSGKERNGLDNLDVRSSSKTISRSGMFQNGEVIDMEMNHQQTPSRRQSAASDNKNKTPVRNVRQEIAVPSSSGENSNPVIPPELSNTCKLPLHMYLLEGQTNEQNSPVKERANNTKNPDPTKAEQPPGDNRVANGMPTNTELTPEESNAGLESNSTAASTDNPNNKSPDEEKDSKDDSKNDASTSNLKAGRPYCQYDSGCYRKNAQHKLEYSHPGDEDYVPYENRPLCEYGGQCYRRSLSHRRQFRHVTTQDPQTSQAADAPVDSVTSTVAGDGIDAGADAGPGAGAGVGSGTGADTGTGTDADAGARTDAGAGAEAGTDTGATADAGADPGTGADAGAGTDAGVDSGADADAGPGSDAVATADAGVGTEAGAGADAGPGADAGATADAGVGTEAGFEADPGTGADAGARADARADAEAGAGAGARAGARSRARSHARAHAGAGADASATSRSGANKERPRGHNKRKRHSDNDRRSGSCRLSVTLSASPRQKRKKKNQTRAANHDFRYDEEQSSPDPFSNDGSSDEYLPSGDSEDDVQYYGKRFFDDSH